MAERTTADSITNAHEQLKRARQDGGCEQIRFWAAEVDRLLDEMNEKP